MPFAHKKSAALLLVSLALPGCTFESKPPDVSAREDFAKKVMATAASGSIEKVEELVIDDRINVRPEAKQLVEFAQGWSPDTGEIKISNDFPEIGQVEVSKKGQDATTTYTISWVKERWTLVMGDPANPSSKGSSGDLPPSENIQPTKSVGGP